MDDVTLARTIHVLAVVLWIGGVGLVTTVLLPAVRRFKSPVEQVAFFEAVEQRFAGQARVTTAVAGLERLPGGVKEDRLAARRVNTANFKNGGKNENITTRLRYRCPWFQPLHSRGTPTRESNLLSRDVLHAISSDRVHATRSHLRHHSRSSRGSSGITLMDWSII